MHRTKSWLMTAAALVGLAVAAPVQAGLLNVDVSHGESGTAGVYRWGYTISLNPDQFLRDGDYFTIYDFKGLVADKPGETPNAAWTYTQIGKGGTPSTQIPTDDPAIMNHTFTYHGPDLMGGSPTPVGEFVLYSTYGDIDWGTTNFSSSTHVVKGGRVEQNTTDVQVPVPGPGGGTPPTETPEPATLAMFGAALPVLGGLKLFRRRRTA